MTSEREPRKTTPEELTPYYQEGVRNFIAERFEDCYNFLKTRNSGGVLAQWDLATESEPRVISYKTRNSTVLVPYVDLDQRFLQVFAGDIEEGTEMKVTAHDIFVNDETELDELHSNLREYWGQTLIGIVYSYKLKPGRKGDRFVKQITYYSGSHSMKMIAERWILEEENTDPLNDNLQFQNVKPKEPLSETGGVVRKETFIPVTVFNFSRN